MICLIRVRKTDQQILWRTESLIWLMFCLTQWLTDQHWYEWWSGWLSNWLTDQHWSKWWSNRLSDWLTNTDLNDDLADSVTDWLTDQHWSEWWSGWPRDRVTDQHWSDWWSAWLSDWLTDYQTDCVNGLLSVSGITWMTYSFDLLTD